METFPWECWVTFSLAFLLLALAATLGAGNRETKKIIHIEGFGLMDNEFEVYSDLTWWEIEGWRASPMHRIFLTIS